ncbi:discoidin domain-containing protein [Curtobacterium sp. MCPF17_047]|uniref:discoidin domain-containing protein n=1 Tax=Curtobacterium sp. MCPF17_047 TaxID=2175654 RepID=UPI0011B42D34|nr:discoidin domain-containing protein [Curtobacterium sp. MCPF17_047]
MPRRHAERPRRSRSTPRTIVTSGFVVMTVIAAVVGPATGASAADRATDSTRSAATRTAPSTRTALPTPATVPAPPTDGTRVGSGSFAPTPPTSISDSADVQKTVDQHLYIDPSQAGKPVPTNQWWTDLLVSKYSGDMWAYPFVSSNSQDGTKLTYPTKWNSDGTAMQLESPVTVSGTVTPAVDPSDELLADFEHGVPDGWTSTGTAFSGATDTAAGQSQVSGWVGNGYLTSWGATGGDGATGTMTSKPFTVDHSTLAFMVAGGKHADQEAVQLVVGGQVVASATGDDSERFRWVDWDVSAWAGQQAQLRVVDSLNAGWAHVMVDQVLLTDEPDGVAQRFSTAFSATEADALRWGDWNVSWRMPQAGAGGQYMDVTSVQGNPYEWFEYRGMTPRLSVQPGATITDGAGEPISFPFTGDRFEIRQGDHVFGVHAPARTTFTRSGNAIDASAGTAYLVLSAVPESGLSLDRLQQYAFAVPRNTTMDYSYDPAAGQVEQQWSVQTDALQGSNHDTVQGWLQHQYAETTNDLHFTGATYATPRGTMKTTIGHDGWTLDYAFTGITPTGASPEGQDERDVLRQYLSDYATKTTYGGDTYWGGKDLQQLAEYMTVARQIGDTDDERKLQATLTKALTDWYTYSTGESEHFFAMYPTWKALIGFGDSYGSAQFNDNHFHYGYFAVATALLGAVDPGWAERYEGMATLVTKQYANWDRDDDRFPHLRTFGVWEGHSNAGGVSSPGGNNQESSSEAIQSEAGLFLLGTVLGNEQMQATGAMEYVTERAAVRDYYQNAHGNTASKSYDGNGAFPDAYRYGQAGILFDSGQAEATYFSGDPAWIYGIQWMPTAPWFDFFGWDPGFSKAIMRQMMQARPRVVGQDGVVNGNAAHIQMLTKKWWGVGTYGNDAIAQDRNAAIGELEDAVRAAEANHPGYVTARTAANPLYDQATGTLFVSTDANGEVVFPAQYWTPTTLPAALVPTKTDGPTADRQPKDWPVQSPLLPYLSTRYTADTATIDRLYSVDLTDHRPGTDTAHAAAVFSDMGDALGNVVLGFLAQYDPDTYLDIHRALWAAGDPAVTGQSMAGLVYHQAASNRMVGTEVTDRHTSDPLSQVFRAADGTYSYVLDNVDDVQHSYDVYEGQRVIGQIAVPAHTQITSHLDAHLAEIVVDTTDSPKTLAPGSTTRFTATGYDQYGATMPLDGLTWDASTGSIAADGTYDATKRADSVTVTASVGSVSDTYRFRVAPAPELTSIRVTPGFEQLVVGTPTTFAAVGSDQYGDPLTLSGPVTWATTLPGGSADDGSVRPAAPGAGYVTATSGGVEGSAVVSAVATVPDQALHATAVATSSDGGNSPGKALDGDPTTRWESEHGQDAVDYTVDLGRATDITDVDVTWENAAAKEYDLQVADDADGPWRTVRNVAKTTAAADHVTVDTTARFVRMHGVDRLTQYGYSIWSFEVHGTPSVSAITPSTVLVGPRTTRLPAGGGTTLTAYGFDADGDGGPVTAAAGSDGAPVWTIDGGGSVTGDGAVTAAAAGGVTSTVSATLGGASGQATITTVTNGDVADPGDGSDPDPGTGTSRDIAVGKPVTTSSDERADLGGEQAVDGSGSTRWASRASDDQWIAVDLGAVVPVDSVRLDWEAAYADRYLVQVRTTTDDDWRTVTTEDHGAGGSAVHELDGVRARYVRMLGVQRHTAFGYSLFAFRVDSTEGAPTPDLARNAPTTSSADEAAGVAARNATDGDPGSRWASGHTDDQWLDVDLGSAQPLHRASLRWEDAYGSAYRIEARNGAGDAWTTIATVGDGDGGTDTVDLSGTWRHVRFQGVHRATPYGYSLYGFEVR